MIDRVFFAILLPLPLIVSAATLIYVFRAWKTKTARLRRTFFITAIWLGACAAMLFFCREKVRGWYGLDSGAVVVFMISSAGAIVLAGILIGLFATIGRSTRGQSLCPRCWYDMSASEPSDGGAVCPECGVRVGAFGDLLRRKNWPILIAVAVVLQMAGQFWYQVLRADHNGIQNFVPTTVLVAGMFSLPADWVIGPPSPFDDITLAGRLANNKAAAWQKSWAISKSVASVESAASPESVSRACIVLSRCGYEGEISLRSWKSALRLLCRSDSPNSEEAFSYLAECYVRARAGTEISGRIAFAKDPSRCEEELRDVVPDLMRHLSRVPTRTLQWWYSLRLLALAPEESGSDLVPFLADRILTDDSDSGRAFSAAALAMLSQRIPAAADAAIESCSLLLPPEQPRSMTAIARYACLPHYQRNQFRAFSTSGEPFLEMIGSVGLMGDPKTRCEGARLAMAGVLRQGEFGVWDLTPLYWGIARDPSDGASTEIIEFLRELALYYPPFLRIGAMSLLTTIAREQESRREELITFLDLVGTDRDQVIAERAQAFAAEARSARNAAQPLRKVAFIP